MKKRQRTHMGMVFGMFWIVIYVEFCNIYFSKLVVRIMVCDACGGELVNSPLESEGEIGRYGGFSWNKVSISRPKDLEEKWSKMSEFYDKTFGYDDPRHGGDDYTNDRYSNKLPEQGTEIEPILEMTEQRPVISANVCKACGSIQSLRSNLDDIYIAIEVVESWIDGEREAKLSKQKAKQKKIREEKRKNYEKQIAALQKKLDNLKED